MSPTISLVVVNYNGLDWIDGCLESILSQSLPAREVIVVDNASADSSPGRIAERYPQVRLVRLPSNVGFAAACNRGIREARGDLVAILNNDIVLSSGWLEALLKHVAPPWDFWASQIVFASDPDRLDSAGDEMAVVGAAYKGGHGESPQNHARAREVFGPCAAAALYRRSMLEKLGGFDEDFFLIYEDADLSMRARLMGHRCLYVPEARVIHHVNSSIGTFSSNYVYYGHRNSEFIFWQNMPTSLLLLYLPERILFDLLSCVYFVAKGRGGPFLRSKWDFLKSLGSVRAKRRRVQAGRRLGTWQFNRLLDRNWLRGRRKGVVAP